MKTRSNPYSSDLSSLRDYLKGGWDPYSFADYLEAFYDEERGGKIPKWLDLNDPGERLVDMSKKDLAAFREWTANLPVKSERLYIKGDYEACTNWVMDHFTQYKKHIAYLREDQR